MIRYGRYLKQSLPVQHAYHSLKNCRMSHIFNQLGYYKMSKLAGILHSISWFEQDDYSKQLYIGLNKILSSLHCNQQKMNGDKWIKQLYSCNHFQIILMIYLVPQKQQSRMHTSFIMISLSISHGSIEKFEAFRMPHGLQAYWMRRRRLRRYFRSTIQTPSTWIHI